MHYFYNDFEALMSCYLEISKKSHIDLHELENLWAVWDVEISAGSLHEKIDGWLTRSS